MISNSDSGSDFIGRKLEMGQLTAALDNVLSGRGQIVMLAGEPGIGKTRAANELAALADTKGFSVLRGWCYEHGGAPALWPWLQCIREYIETLDAGQLRREMGPGAADIAEILPELTAKLDGLGPPPPLDPAQARFRLFFSITTFFKNASQTQPMLLVLDDLHWADESSILLLEFLTKEIPGTSLMIVGTFRDGKISGRHLLSRTLGELVRERHFHRVHLEGLSREEVGEFIGSRSGIDVPQSAVNTLHERTGGNPLFVGEVVSSVSPEEIALNQDWVSAIPEAVRDAILRRLSGLSDSCNQLLLTASVMGSEFELSSLQQQASEIDEVAFPESLNEPLASRIIGPLGPGSGRYQFSHALIQQAVYQEIPPIKKAQAHAAMAESLEHLHRDSLVQHAGELAYHFAGAQKVLGSDKLVYFPLIVGEQAIEAFSHEQAMVHFNNVLAAKEGMAEDSVIAAARFGLGRAQTAVLPRHELGLAHENLSRAFEYYASAGNTAKIVAIAFEFYAPQLSEYGLRTGGLVEKALELVPADSLDTGRLHAYRGSILGLGQGDFQSARDSLDRTLIVARQEGNSALEIRALITSAQLESWNNHFEDGLAYGLTAIEKAVAASDLRGEVTARYWACLGSFSSGDTKETERQSSIFLESAGRLRDRNWGAAAHDSVARPFTLRGKWQSAREMVQPGLDQMLHDPRILLQRVVLDAQTGERDQAEFHLDLMEQIAQRAASGANTPNALLAYVAPVAKYIFGALRQPEMGESSITTVLSSPVDIPFFSTFARIGASLSAAMEKDAEAASAQYTVLCSSNARMFMFTSLDRVLGLLAGTMGNLDNAVAHFENGRGYCRESGYLPELAWTCHDHAAVLLELGPRRDRSKATALLDECLSIASELGMSPLMAKAAAVQEVIGAGPGRSTSYPGGLSLREIEVLTHLAQGRTNREIARDLVLSERTVQRHISNIYTKINVRNRAEATTFALNQLPS